jgi:hypothetical protein
MERTLYRCKVKATEREGDQLRWSRNWAFARRGELRLTDRAIRCGDWTIPYLEIDDAALLVVPMKFFTAYNLRVKSQGETYTFALRSTSAWRWKLDPYWLGETPFPMRQEVAIIDREGSTRFVMMLMLFQSTAACLLFLVVLIAGEASGYIPGGVKNCPLILAGWGAAAAPVFAECLWRRLKARKLFRS